MQPVPQQHPDIRKTGLTLAELQEVTFEALSSFFAESESNLQKRKFLIGIFKIAQNEERYKMNELR